MHGNMVITTKYRWWSWRSFAVAQSFDWNSLPCKPVTTAGRFIKGLAFYLASKGKFKESIKLSFHASVPFATTISLSEEALVSWWICFLWSLHFINSYHPDELINFQCVFSNKPFEEGRHIHILVKNKVEPKCWCHFKAKNMVFKICIHILKYLTCETFWSPGLHIT